ncbi:hypothetical protein [Maridesulfovibrio frigidus]|uniref:hypothetical protein n=1 Tax=Maridesulfovibrio frigidus TaxID=340956 RepID=UPI0012EB25C2|nr:hypothetical protein [Maridesulfovibrio frigidus]
MNTQGLQDEILHAYLSDQSGPRIQPTCARRIARITGGVPVIGYLYQHHAPTDQNPTQKAYPE